MDISHLIVLMLGVYLGQEHQNIPNIKQSLNNAYETYLYLKQQKEK